MTPDFKLLKKIAYESWSQYLVENPAVTLEQLIKASTDLGCYLEDEPHKEGE